jgi:diguanylate cyclase (GGDEF)-like protein/PAS domain S-box-containing protein
MDDITLTRMTQEQLIEELRHYRYRKLLLNSIDRIARIGYYEWSHDENRLLSCSEEYANIFCMTPAQMLEAESNWEKSLLGVHEDDREEYSEKTANLTRSTPIELEYRIVRNDGEVRYVRENSVMETDEKSGNTVIFGILQDITGLREQREALEYREVLAQQAESITEIGHFIYNEQLTIYKYISPGFARILGVTPDQYRAKILTAEDDLNDIHEEDRFHVQQAYDQYDEDGVAYSVEYRIFRPNGEMRWVRERCVTYSEKNGETLESLGVLQDITHQQDTESRLLKAREKLESTVTQLRDEIAAKEKIEAELKFLANHDALTSLPSLRLCMDRLERSIVQAERDNHGVFVMFVDLDDFKKINDNFGHDRGDEVLKVTAKRIQNEIRATDTAARIGGDEFLVILSGDNTRATVEHIAAKLVTSISREITIDQDVLGIGASIGIASYPGDGENAEELVKQADSAMYTVKQQDKNNFSFIAAGREFR